MAGGSRTRGSTSSLKPCASRLNAPRSPPDRWQWRGACVSAFGDDRPVARRVPMRSTTGERSSASVLPISAAAAVPARSRSTSRSRSKSAPSRISGSAAVSPPVSPAAQPPRNRLPRGRRRTGVLANAPPYRGPAGPGVPAAPRRYGQRVDGRRMQQSRLLGPERTAAVRRSCTTTTRATGPVSAAAAARAFNESSPY